MKEAIITDLKGRYIEPTLVADSVTGVFDRVEPVKTEDEAPQAASNEQNVPETVLVGYTVAITLPDGLYEPTFDVEGYRKAVKVYEVAFDAYLEARAAYDPEGEEPKPKSPQHVDGSSFWRNGLTDEEIEALKPKPQPSQTDVLGQEFTQMKIKNIQQQSVIDGLGRELTKAKLEIMRLKGGQTA
jgi:XkdW protein